MSDRLELVANPEPRVVVCYGDSNTWASDPDTGLRMSHAQRWTTILGHELGPGFDVIAEGLGGRTAGFDDPTRPGRNGRDHMLPCLWSHAPIETVVLMLGTNDVKSFFDATAEEIADHVEALTIMISRDVAGSAAPSPRTMIVVPPPLGSLPVASEDSPFAGRQRESRRLAEAYRSVAERQGALFLDAGQVISSSRSDGVHLDVAAHRVLGVTIAAALRD